MTRDEFARKIAEKRADLGENQESFGERFKVTQQAVVGWEDGSSMPGKRKLEEVCALIGVPIEEATRLRRLSAQLSQKYSLQGDHTAGYKITKASHGGTAISAGGQVTNTLQESSYNQALKPMESVLIELLRKRPDGNELLERYVRDLLTPPGK